MKSIAKFAGKKQEWPEIESEHLKDWSFEKRPGGWVIAEKKQGGVTIERKRFYYSKVKQQFFAKLTSGASSDVFGERIIESRGSAAGSSASDYTAQFPGKVRKIMVAVGDQVAAGAPLLMVEAMKMEFAIKASSAGTVKKILVTEGVQLSPGQVLIDIEEQK